MNVKVRLFGPQAALVGVREVAVDIDDGATATMLLEALRREAPALSDSLGVSRVAINHEFAAADQVIAPGDEVALIGMVSGG